MKAPMLSLLFLLVAGGAFAAPQYSVVDLGSSTIAGAGILFQPKQAESRPDLPSSGGNQCLSGFPVNYVTAQYGSVAVGEVAGGTETISSKTGGVLNRAFVYTGGTMYNLTFYLVGGPTVLLSDAYWIDCQGNIAAVGTPAAGGTTHSYLLLRQGAPRTNCPQ